MPLLSRLTRSLICEYTAIPIPEIYCDITVASAAPAAPLFKTRTNRKSNPIFSAGKPERIRKGLNGAAAVSMIFCVVISAAVWAFAHPLMLMFVQAEETVIIAEGIRYLRIEGAFYFGIGFLFFAAPLFKTRTNRKSNPIFSNAETARNTSGTTEFPIDLSSEAK